MGVEVFNSACAQEHDGVVGRVAVPHALLLAVDGVACYLGVDDVTLLGCLLDVGHYPVVYRCLVGNLYRCVECYLEITFAVGCSGAEQLTVLLACVVLEHVAYPVDSYVLYIGAVYAAADGVEGLAALEACHVRLDTQQCIVLATDTYTHCRVFDGEAVDAYLGVKLLAGEWAE